MHVYLRFWKDDGRDRECGLLLNELDRNSQRKYDRVRFKSVRVTLQILEQQQDYRAMTQLLKKIRMAPESKSTAILIEGIQGEGGVTPATGEYLLGLRQLCDDKDLLLMMDGVQCGHFRTGSFQSYQSILGKESKFAPDAVAWQY